MICKIDCAYEQCSCDSRSVGIVRDGEFLCRATFDPNHHRSDSEIKPGVISNNQLLKGEISVWRVSSEGAADIPDILNRLVPPPGNQVRGLAIISVRVLRSGRVGINSGRFCVLDECATDEVGGFHPKHAHISFCRERKFVEADKTSEEFQAVKSHLVNIIKHAAFWENPSFLKSRA